METKPASPRGSYAEAAVACIDLLGFKDLVAGAGDDASAPMEAVRALRGALDPGGSAVNLQQPPRLVTLSDMALYMFPDQPDGPAAGHELDWTCRMVARAQRTLLTMGLFVRGGVARGRVYCDPESYTVFGPAVDEAVEMEQGQAVFPRVVVAPNLVTPEQKQRVLNGDWGSVITFGDDVWFVNYLYPDPGTTPQIRLNDMFQEHKQVVLQYAMKACDPRAQSNVIWARTYHNAYVDLHVGDLDAGQKRQLLIENPEFFGSLLTPSTPSARSSSTTAGAAPRGLRAHTTVKRGSSGVRRRR